MKCIRLGFILLFLYNVLSAQNLSFENVFGGPASDAGSAVLQGNDSNYVFVGSIIPSQFENDKYFIAKANQQGQLIWMLKDSTNNDAATSISYSIIKTDNGNYVVSGHRSFINPIPVSSLHTASLLFKTDANGDTLFFKHYYAPSANSVEESHKVIETLDNGYAMVGYAQYVPDDSAYWGFSYPYSASFIQIRRTNVQGNLLWSKLYGVEGSNGWSIVQLSDSGFVAAGIAPVPGLWHDIVLIRTDKNGAVIWQQNYGGTNYDYAYDIKKTPDNNLLILSNTMSAGHGGVDVQLTKMDINGNIIWEKQYGGLEDDYGNHVSLTSDGGYIITGSTSNFNCDFFDVYIIKVDANGNEQWQQTYGGESFDAGYGIEQTFDGGYIITGVRAGQIYLLKLDGNGMLAGVTDFNSPHPGFIIYPNPASDLVKISIPETIQGECKLRMYDARGTLVLEKNMLNNDLETVDLQTLPAGVYQVQIMSENHGWYHQKIIITR
jgi:hypothetical protein